MRKGIIRIGTGCILTCLQLLSDMGNAKAGYVYAISFDNASVFAYDVIFFISSHIIGILGIILLASGLTSFFKSRKADSESLTSDEHRHNIHPVEPSLSEESKQGRGRERERLLIVAIILLIALNIFQFVSNRATVSELEAIIYELQVMQPVVAATVPSEAPALPEPFTGYVFRDIKMDLTSPLTIETNGECGFFVVFAPIELTGTYNGNEPETNYEAWKHMDSQMDSYIKIYIRGNDLYKLKIPPGEYEIYYAAGRSWRGLDNLFGSKTTYYKYENTVTFEDCSSGYDKVIIQLVDSDIAGHGIVTITSSDFPK